MSSVAFASNGGGAVVRKCGGLFASRTRVGRRPRVVEPPQRPARMDAGEKMPPRLPDTGNGGKAGEFAKLYGGSYLGTSMAMAVLSYSTWYALIKGGVDVVALVQALGDWLATTPIGRPQVLSRVNETVGTATLAYIAHKASSPLRFPLTIAATPFVARAFSKNGDRTKRGD